MSSEPLLESIGQKKLMRIFETGCQEMDQDPKIIGGLKASILTDQDKHRHIIFYDTETRGRNYIKTKLYYLYNTFFSTGDLCLKRKRLYNLKYKFNGSENSLVDLLTLASIYLINNQFTENCVDMDLMSKMLGWLYKGI